MLLKISKLQMIKVDISIKTGKFNFINNQFQKGYGEKFRTKNSLTGFNAELRGRYR